MGPPTHQPPRCRTTNHASPLRSGNRRQLCSKQSVSGSEQKRWMNWMKLGVYINEWRDRRQKELDELSKLKEKQAKRRVLRAEEEKKLLEQKKQEEERKKKEEEEEKKRDQKKKS